MYRKKGDASKEVAAADHQQTGKATSESIPHQEDTKKEDVEVEKKPRQPKYRQKGQQEAETGAAAEEVETIKTQQYQARGR